VYFIVSLFKVQFEDHTNFPGRYLVLLAYSCSHASLKYELLISDLTIEKYMRWEGGGRG
jgi:hypothetical protein